MLMLVEKLAYIIVIAGSLFISLLVITRKARKRQDWLFSGASFVVALWVLSIYLLYQVEAYSLMIIFGRLSFVWVILFFYFFSEFVIEFPIRKDIFVYQKTIRVVSLIGAIVFSVISAFTPFIIKDVNIANSEPIPVLGTLYPVFIGYVFVYIAYLVILIIRKYRLLSGVFRRQIIYIVYGVVLAIIIAVSTNLLIPYIFNISAASKFGPLSSVFLIITTMWTIRRNRFLDIRYVFNKALAIFLFALVVYSIFYGVTVVQVIVWKDIYSVGALVSGVLIAIAFSVLLPIARLKIQELVDKSLVRAEYNSDSVLDKLGNMMNSTLEIRPLLSETLTELCATMIVENGFVEVSRAINEECLYVEYKRNDDQSGFFNSGIFALSAKVLGTSGLGKTILTYELEQLEENEEIASELRMTISRLVEVLNNSGVQLITAIKSGTSMVGMLCLGRKESNEVFTIGDIQLIENITTQLAVAIERAKLYGEVQQFNVKLQHEVEVATKKLKVQNEQLKEMDKIKDDLISIAGHELRTPATVAKGNLYLLKKKIDGPDRDKYLERAEDAIEREAELVTILLEASRIGKDTLDLIVEPLKLEDMAKEAVEDHTSSAEKKGLKITFEKPKAPHSEIYGDRTRVREIIDNLVTNAIKYTEKGSIKVWTEEKDEKVWFHIKDTGVGIPEEEIPNLFQKFYRIRNYTSGTKHLLRPGGTGLGLYVSKNLAKRHGGDVLVESKVGVGSTFSFYIPLAFKGNLGAVKDLPKDKSEPDLFKVMGLTRQGQREEEKEGKEAQKAKKIGVKVVKSTKVPEIEDEADVTAVRLEVPVKKAKKAN